MSMNNPYSKEEVIKLLDAQILSLESDITMAEAFLEMTKGDVFKTSTGLIKDGLQSAREELESTKLIKNTLLGN